MIREVIRMGFKKWLDRFVESFNDFDPETDGTYRSYKYEEEDRRKIKWKLKK